MRRGTEVLFILWFCSLVGFFETGAWSTDLTELNLHLFRRQPSKYRDHSLG